MDDRTYSLLIMASSSVPLITSSRAMRGSCIKFLFLPMGLSGDANGDRGNGPPDADGNPPTSLPTGGGLAPGQNGGPLFPVLDIPMRLFRNKSDVFVESLLFATLSDG